MCLILKAQVPSPKISLVYQVVTRDTKEELEGRFEEKDEPGKINRFASRSFIRKLKAMQVEGTF